MTSPVYATLDDLKDRIGIDVDTFDGGLTIALDAAHGDVTDDTGGRVFSLDGSVSERVFNPSGRMSRTHHGFEFIVDDIGDVTGLIVEVGSGTSWTAITDYETQPDNALVKGDAVTCLLRQSPWCFDRRTRLRVTAKWGWPSVPAKIKDATLIAAQRRYGRKESPNGVASFGDLGPIRVSRSDPDYWASISRFVLTGFGGA